MDQCISILIVPFWLCFDLHKASPHWWLMCFNGSAAICFKKYVCRWLKNIVVSLHMSEWMKLTLQRDNWSKWFLLSKVLPFICMLQRGICQLSHAAPSSLFSFFSPLTGVPSTVSVAESKMVRAALVTATSLALTGAVVAHAYLLKHQFYPTVVYLTKSSPSMAVRANLEYDLSHLDV